MTHRLCCVVRKNFSDPTAVNTPVRTTGSMSVDQNARSDQIRLQPRDRTQTSSHPHENHPYRFSEDYKRVIQFVRSKSETSERSRTTTTSSNDTHRQRNIFNSTVGWANKFGRCRVWIHRAILNDRHWQWLLIKYIDRVTLTFMVWCRRRTVSTTLPQWLVIWNLYGYSVYYEHLYYRTVFEEHVDPRNNCARIGLSNFEDYTLYTRLNFRTCAISRKMRLSIYVEASSRLQHLHLSSIQGDRYHPVWYTAFREGDIVRSYSKRKQRVASRWNHGTIDGRVCMNIWMPIIYHNQLTRTLILWWYS